MLMAKGLEGFELSSWPSVSSQRFHLQAEFARLAYAERDAFIADPRTGEVPVDWLLSEAHSAQTRRRISLTRRIPAVDTYPARPHSDTVFICVVDRDRTAVALIDSIFEDFGSGIVCGRTGIVLHNRGSSFSLEPDHPNVLAGRKRPMHTIIPAILAKGDKPLMPFGVTGAHFQPSGQIQILTNIVDYGLSVQAAIDHPRMFARMKVLNLSARSQNTSCKSCAALGITSPGPPVRSALRRRFGSTTTAELCAAVRTGVATG